MIISIHFALFILRLVLGSIFLVHGLSKRAMWKMESSEQMPKGFIRIMRTLSIIEPIAGLCVILGLFTPIAAFAMCIVMLGAMWFKINKWHMPFMSTAQQSGWEFDLINLATAILLIASGPGLIALDVLLFR